MTYELAVRPLVQFEQVKSRARASIDRNREDWADDEAVAGEQAEPIALDQVVGAALDAVDGARDLKEMFERLAAAWPY